MPTREKIAIGEYYHIYNRGVDKRQIMLDEEDAERFLDSLEYFNAREPIVSLREIVSREDKTKPDPLADIICYALNTNHFHLLLKEKSKGGISEFMQRVGGGYTWYFNNKNKRSGSLFQGTFKSVHMESNEQLLHVSAYINLNWKAHKFSGLTAGRARSSWDEYMGKSSRSLCNKKIILGQFKSIGDYKNFAESSLREILRMKEQSKNDPEMLIGKYFF